MALSNVNPLLLAVALDDDGFEAIQQMDALDAGHCSATNNAIMLALSSEPTPSPSLFNHRIEGFVQNDIPRYNDPTFKAHFRMEKSTFQILLEELSPNLTSRGVKYETKILSTIWLLSNNESFRSVADRFGMSKGSLHHHIMEVVSILSDAVTRHIIWPNSDAMFSMANATQSQHGFPGAFGYVDGCHIPIKGRSANRDSFINRHGHSSILLQGVCDNNMQFIHMYTGWPGSVHDARVFRNSDLPELLSSTVPEQLHILGDSAFPLQQSLLTPFKENGRLTAVQKKYNMIHGSTRSVVERAFALLKGKFRRLKYLDMSLDLSIPKVITSCLVLHNVILKNECDPNFSMEETTCARNEGVCTERPSDISASALRKRENIATRL